MAIAHSIQRGNPFPLEKILFSVEFQIAVVRDWIQVIEKTDIVAVFDIAIYFPVQCAYQFSILVRFTSHAKEIILIFPFVVYAAGFPSNSRYLRRTNFD